MFRHHSARFQPAIEDFKESLSPLFRQGDVQVSSLLVNRSLVRGHGVVRPTLLNDAIQLSKNVGGK